MAGINISSLTKTNSTPATTRRRSTPSLSQLSDAYRNPSKHETDTLPVIREQSVSKASQEREQESHESVSKASQEREQEIKEHDKNPESVSKASQERRPVREQVREQSVSKASREREQKKDINELSKQEDSLLKYLFEVCSSLGQRKTPKIANHTVAALLQTTSGTLRNLLLRLKKKNFLIVLKTKNGPSGWRTYELPEATYKHLSDQRNLTRASLEREESVSRASQNASLGASPALPSSNSSNIINTITTREDDWVQLIQTPLNLKNLGLGQGHIKQLKEKFFLTPEQIQHGLEAFAYDLEKGELERLKSRGVQNIIGYFFGAMKSGGYNPINEGFITAEDLAEKEMIERLENRKKERKERSEKLIDLLFAEWLETKSREELIKIQNPIHQYLDMFHKADLKNHFKKNEMELFRREF